MLRWMSGVTKLDRIRNERIRGTTKVGEISKKVQESRLKWYGHVLRREDEYVGKRVMAMELPGKRRRGRSKRRWLDSIMNDLSERELSREDTSVCSQVLNYIAEWTEASLREGKRSNFETVANGIRNRVLDCESGILSLSFRASTAVICSCGNAVGFIQQRSFRHARCQKERQVWVL